ncbi:MAG: M14 family zinc carboxypeptidase [Planctomycetota bacterium]
MLGLALTLVSSAVPQGIGDAVEALCARSDGIATSERIGTSRGGRPILALTLARRDGPSLERRPGVLVVAGVHGQHRLGTDLALHHAEALLDGGADDRARRLLEQGVVYVVAQLNPDGTALRRPGNGTALDLDRDGSTDEDPHDDLNSDGHIAQMRWPDPEGEWIIDPDEPRVMRKADPAKGEVGTHAVALEGIDNDGDDRRDEDVADGVLLHRSFSHDFAEHDPRSGQVALGEPEARALADFVFGHRNIGVAFVYGVDDCLLGKPKADKGDKRRPLRGILEDDAELYASVGELYRDKTGRSGSGGDRHDGSVWSWLYCDVGVPAFATSVWSVPPSKAEKDQPKPTPEQARLAQCEAAGRGFVDWASVEHPDLEDVEVGGFVDLPESALLADDARGEVLDQHHDWWLEVCSRRPACRIAELTAKDLGDNAYEITATVANDGRAPALSAISAKSRRFPRPRLIFDAGGATVVAGELRQRTDNLTGLGGRAERRWIVTGEPGTTVTLELITDFAGCDRKEIQL